MDDEVNEPLGLLPGPAADLPGRRVPKLGRAAVGAVVFAAAIGFFANAHREAPRGAEPIVAARVEAARSPPGASDPAPDPLLPAIASADQVEAVSGVKITRSGGAGAPHGVIIDVQQALGVALEPAPDKRLIEKSRYGLLPRVGADGASAFDVYSRPIVASSRLRAHAPRVALMVGGLGLDPEGSGGAIAKLPGAVTLGFAPYGESVDRQAAEARAGGHETVLQAPMEGFANLAADPGPHTLTTSASAAENFDSLQWLMGRFVGYVAVANTLGGKFTADQHAISPVLSEIAARGLGYLDDGSSPQSLAPDIAKALAMPSTRADVVIDANPSAAAIDAALERLIDLARRKGSAIGVASASPASVDRIAHWTSGLEAKGIALVPLSAMMSRAPGPSAQSSP